MLVLVVDGCEVVEGGVATLAVVEDLDEVEHRSSQGLAAWPVVAVEQLTLQGGEEALGHRVVQGVADGAHRGDQAGRAEPATEGQAGVLAAVVAVMDQLGPWLALGDRHVEGVKDQLGA